MKRRFIKYPYEKEYISEIETEKEVDGKKYIIPKENIIFKGNKHTFGDKYQINSRNAENLNIIEEDFYEVDGTYIKMTLDFDRRLDLMQQNLGSAILRICILKSTTYDIADYKIDEKSNKIYVKAKDISFKTIEKLEELANYIINANLLVRIFEDAEKVGIKGMGSIDYMAPCLRRTGEVSLLKIGNIEKENGKIILEIKCGKRALVDYQKKSRIIDDLKRMVSVEDDEKIISSLKEIRLKGEGLKLENKKMEQELKLDSVKEYRESAKIVNGIGYIYKIEQNVNFKELDFVSNKLMNEMNYIQIYGIPNGSMAQIIVTRSRNLNVNLKEIYDKLEKRFQLKGTGNMFKIKANVSSVKLAGAMEAFLLEIKNNIEK